MIKLGLRSARPTAGISRKAPEGNRSPVMRRYLVIFDPAARVGAVEEVVRATQGRIAQLQAFIAEQGLKDDLGAVGRPTALGAIGILGTPRLARLLRRAPGIDQVVQD